MDFDQVVALFKALREEGVEYILVGAVALTVHGIVRATQDVDLFIKTEEKNVGRLRAALVNLFPGDPSIDEISAGDLAGPYPVIRYISPDGALVIDLISRIGEMFSYEKLRHEERNYAGVPVRVATPASLYEMKKGTLRLQDQADAAALQEAFDLKE